MRTIVDKKGEQFAYMIGNVLYTLDGERSGLLEGDFMLDLAGNRFWRVVGDGIYTLDSSESIGFIGPQVSDEYWR